MDMRQVITPNSDQINADDLIGGPRTIRITDVKIAPVSNRSASTSKATTGSPGDRASL